MGPDSNYEKKSVSSMSTAHRIIRHEVESIGEILSSARNEAGLSSTKYFQRTLVLLNFMVSQKYTRPPKPICLTDPSFPVLALLPAG